MKLTDTKCRKAAKQEKEYKLADGGGLYLLVTKTGSKLWKWKYRFNGVERKLSLGAYPEVSLRQARQLVAKQRELLAAEIDPAAHKRIKRLEAQYATATTFKAVGEEYLAKMEKEGRAPATMIKARWMFSLLTPSLGTRPISEIQPLEVLRVLKDLEAKDQLETARKVRALASRIFLYAGATGRKVSDPCHTLKGAVASPQVKSHAALLDPVEIGGLMRSIRSYSGDPIIQLALEFSAHVFQRPGEIRQARWTEFDLDSGVWTIPAEVGKGYVGSDQHPQRSPRDGSAVAGGAPSAVK